MYKGKATIINELGLHARPASTFVKISSKFFSDINLVCNGQEGIAKSILSVMALNACKGDIIEISAEGEDAQAAVEALVSHIEEGCGE